MPARKLYFDSIRIGDELPALQKSPLDRVQLCRYAGASGDFNPVHVDETYAKGLGMPSVYAHGMLIMGFLGQLVSDWARGGQLRKYAVKFIKIAWPGDSVVCKGRVTDRWGEGGRYFTEVDIWVENQKGELVLKGQATLQLFYSVEDESRQRSGQPPIVVEVPRETIKVPRAVESSPAPSPVSASQAISEPSPEDSPATGAGAIKPMAARRSVAAKTAVGKRRK